MIDGKVETWAAYVSDMAPSYGMTVDEDSICISLHLLQVAGCRCC
jgi:hypothetical protein